MPATATGLSTALVQSSLLAVVAFAMGGVIAKCNFVVPATVVVALAWFAITGHSIYLGSSIGQPLWDYVVWSLPSSVLIPAAAVGAKIGTVAAARFARSTAA